MTNHLLSEYESSSFVGNAPTNVVAIMKNFEYFTRMVTRVKSALSEILTVEEVAAYLKITERSVYGLLSKQKLPAFKVGGSWRFRRDEIENLTRNKELPKKKGHKK